MSLTKDQGVCIGKRDYSESSQIVTLFGRASGKIRAIAKGSRRAKGTFGGGIDVLTGGSIIFSPGRAEGGLATLTEFDLDRPFAQVRRDILTLTCAQCAAHLLDRYTEEMDPYEQLYDEFCRTLEAMGAAGDPERQLVPFELKLLGQVGLMPIWDRCSVCGGGLGSRARRYFRSRAGGMLCADCEPAAVEKRAVGAGALDVLQTLSQAESARAGEVIEAHELLAYHHRETLGSEQAVMKMVRQLLGRKAHR